MKFTIAIISVFAVLLPSAAFAQQQTAQGAQKFLAAQAEGSGGAGMHPFFGVDGLARCVREFWGDEECVFNRESGILKWTLMQIDSVVDESGNSDYCVTRIARMADSPMGHVRNGRSWVFPGSAGSYQLSSPWGDYKAPRHLHWGKVSVSRERIEARGKFRDYVMARYLPSPGAKVEVLGFAYDDSGTADRVEYAMKFLQASCDESASTGF